MVESEPRTRGPAAGPLVVSETNPRYFAGDGVTAEREGETTFSDPFGGAGSTVLYLKRVES
jgi:hypothetical protein